LILVPRSSAALNRVRPDWQCEYVCFEQDGNIATLVMGEPAIGYASGVEGVQTLCLAMQSARAMLEGANVVVP
jgi:hypothetical protein